MAYKRGTGYGGDSKPKTTKSTTTKSTTKKRPTYEDHIKYFGSSQAYADAIKNKGDNLSDKSSAQAFRDEYPELFNVSKEINPDAGKDESTSAGSDTGSGTEKGSTSSTKNITDLYNARTEQELADLEKAREAALSNLQAEKATIQPAYYDLRNKETAKKQQEARNFNEYMAARGMTNAGANTQAQLSQNVAYQGNVGQLTRQEQAALDEIQRSNTEVLNAYEQDKIRTKSGIESERLQQLIDENRYRDSYRLQEAGLTGELYGEPTLAGKEFALNKEESIWNRDFAEKEAKRQAEQEAKRRGLEWARLDKQTKQNLIDNKFKEISLGMEAQQYEYEAYAPAIARLETSEEKISKLLELEKMGVSPNTLNRIAIENGIS